MPDDWEKAKGLNPNDATDGFLDAGDGYTNLEMFLNGENTMTVITDLQTVETSLRQQSAELAAQADVIAQAIIALQVIDDQLDALADIIEVP
jgi:hypothetical protein